MAEKDLYDEFETLTSQLNDISKKVSLLKEELSRSLEEKEELKMENHNLRKHLEKIGYEDKDFKGNTLSDSRLNLENLYRKGFHVCQQFYGTHRKNKEECIFCMNVLYGSNGKGKRKKAIR
ncbi:initiation control protein YabA [Companilactobacillus halodurans]|uniref:DNA replication initiation control protein YabA n=1 Tax=Companilactobacillus halodurans TaxID=2584183 RepID=A0A5P0ZPH5_9LACO|nr:initiation control protein YabA [Companilactobacillus halodurans]MQS75761.1 DNA replication initiation control protein YabA [Companilactobacillus halodurans]MQS98464.1 DNA replication initiation control protein YabA [Companilactobacillus halodurans]